MSEIIVPKRPVGRPKLQNPISKTEYGNKYYQQHKNLLMKCNVCNCMVKQITIAQHKKSRKCKSYLSNSETPLNSEEDIKIIKEE